MPRYGEPARGIPRCGARAPGPAGAGCSPKSMSPWPGARQSLRGRSSCARNRSACAYLLWFFFGAVSAHRFYLGYPSSAVIQASLWFVSWMMLAAGFLYAAFGLLAAALWMIGDASSSRASAARPMNGRGRTRPLTPLPDRSLAGPLPAEEPNQLVTAGAISGKRGIVDLEAGAVGRDHEIAALHRSRSGW